MKGTLLVLALLVTHELGFERADACPIFYMIFGKVLEGFRLPMYLSLSLVHATEEEKEAFAKIQDCYNEAGIKAKLLDLLVMTTITTSKTCVNSTVDEVLSILKDLREKLLPKVEALQPVQGTGSLLGL
ncbi:major allergen I polypeptide chain 2-like isoform X1 [Erinaceus europaeus]|uniref:Major allergen I polypeptide chain 2-like isoform X1 n=1 Tax=Erinaceus europaeus TaxID=9365 RepID=A0A1S3AS39_ERIEU|nr:major allergen I polypeptide chain 2-like isoform X1 [Erinaceus europaeus]